MFNLGNINAVSEWTYKINGHSYTLNTCQPTTEAKRAGLKDGDIFTVNGENFVFSDGKATRQENIQKRPTGNQRQLKKASKLFQSGDLDGLRIMLGKCNDPAVKRYICDCLRWK